ncbi:MAG: SNF2-related protein [Pseudomonadota bacterium]
MNIFKKWLHNASKEEKGYEYTYSKYGLHFSSDQHKACQNGTVAGLLAHQFVLLRILVEQGLAEDTKDGFFLENTTANKLDATYRDVLQLPPLWHGKLLLDVRGTTASSNFSLKITLATTGAHKWTSYVLRGPILKVDEEEYLPSFSHITTLHAVHQHSQLSSKEKTSSNNLQAVYEIQEAQRNDASISLSHFKDFTIAKPERVGVSVMEQADGSLELIPSFKSRKAQPDFETDSQAELEPNLQRDFQVEHGSDPLADLQPEHIKACLGQLQKDSTLRINKTLIALDEQRLKAVHEILSCKAISAKEKRVFLRSPEAYLDASLVDLDTGLSIRVYGMEVFQKAYFGQTESSELSWFASNDDAKVLMLSPALPFIQSHEDIDILENNIQSALQENKSSITFDDKVILLLDDADEIKKTINTMRCNIDKKNTKVDSTPEKKSKEKSEHITVGIEKNDTELFEELEVVQPHKPYAGDIGRDSLLYKFYDYQEEGTRWLVGLMDEALRTEKETQYTGALLADDMGLGKTFMVLAALRKYMRLSEEKGQQKPILAVMPVILLENWRKEIDNVFKDSPFSDIVILQSGSDLKRYCRDGAANETQIRQSEEMPSHENWRYALKVGSVFGTERLDMPSRLVLTNYDTLRNYQLSLCMVDWGCVIFDEAQEIKNPNALKSRAAKGLKADFRLAVSGTPVENSLTDFWSLLDTVTPGLLGAYQDFQKHYIRPVEQAQSTQEKDQLRLELGKELRKTVGNVMLRRTKEEKLSGLPTKFIHDGTEDSSYQVCMTGKQLEMYNAVVSTVVAAKQSGDKAKVRQTILPSLLKLRDVSLHPELLDGGIPTLSTSKQEVEAILRRSGKLALMLDILQKIQARNEKVIIFVINKRLQAILSCAFQVLFGMKVSIINGDTKAVTSNSGRGAKSRMQLIKEFEAQNGFAIICMSPLAAGVGVTVTGANNVIHLERHWNPAKEAQATDRVYRIGATKDVHIYVPILNHPELDSFDYNLGILLRKKIDIKEAVIGSSTIEANDFDINRVFGDTFSDDILTADWLPSLGWKNFELLTAVLAEREFGGIAYLTPKTGDLGADVIIKDGQNTAILQCTDSIHPFMKATKVKEPYTAVHDYGLQFDIKFKHCIFAINAPSIGSKVYEKAKVFHVTLWDREYITTLLQKHKVKYSDLTSKENQEGLIL